MRFPDPNCKMCQGSGSIYTGSVGLDAPCGCRRTRVFHVRVDGAGFASTIEAPGPREAAAGWAEREDIRCDCVVSVTAPDGAVTRWRLDGWAVWSYQARPVPGCA